MPPVDPNVDYSTHIQLPSQIPTNVTAAIPFFFSVLSAVIARINGGLSQGSGDHLATRGNLTGRTYDLLTPATPDTDFEVRHDLGYRPQHCVIVRADRAAIIYDSATIARTEAIVGLKCNVASATLKLEIY